MPRAPETPSTPDTRALAERVKELTALHRSASILLEHRALDDRLRDLVAVIPAALQFPESATIALRTPGGTHATSGHRRSAWTLEIDDPHEGLELEVAYHEQRWDAGLDPFLEEERALLTTLLRMISASVARERSSAAESEMLERMNHAFAAANMGVWELDVATRTSRWSAQLSTMMGLNAATVGPVWANLDVVHPDDRAEVTARVERAARGETANEVELRMRRPEGGWRRMLASLHVVRDVEGRPRKVIAALRDVTEQRVLEDAVRQAQKLEALGQVAAGVAHDFNNILMIILSGAAFMKDAATSDELREVATDVVEAAERGAALTRQLLAFSRRSSFTPAPIDVTEVVEQLGPLLVRVAGKAVTMRIDAGAVGGRVWADRTQIEQVVLNLVVNARDAMAQGGHLSIVTRGVIATDSADRERPHALIEVGDTGAGIPADVLPHVFEPFFTTKGPGAGTGLGLAVVMRIVRQWQGRLELETALGVGTTFRVLLPLIDGAADGGDG